MSSAAESAYCEQSVQQGVRLDGRQRPDFRPIELELGLIAQANGSARLHLGATDVLVGVKVEVGEPKPSKPDHGVLHVDVECSPCASPDYEGRGGDLWSAELATSLSQSLRPLPHSEGYGVNLRSLSIISGKRCWHLYVDCMVLNDDGNVLDALSLACLAALANTRIPRVEIVAGEDGEEPELELDDDMEHSMRVELKEVPVIVSVAQVANVMAVDLNLQEEACSGATMHVAVNAKGKVCGTWKEGREALGPSMLTAMMEFAQQTGPKLYGGIKNYVDSLEGMAA